MKCPVCAARIAAALMDLSFNANQGSMRPGTTCPVPYALPPTERGDITDEEAKKTQKGLLMDANGTQMR